MSIRPLHIVFTTDGTGVYIRPGSPLHLDALMAWCLAPFHSDGEPPTRDGEPVEIPLPLDRWTIAGQWGWKASALFPVGSTVDSIQFWRKRFRQNRAEMLAGTANITSGTYRDWNVPMQLVVCRQWEAWAVGDRGRVQQVLKRVRYLGKKRAYGYGRVCSVEVTICQEDLSMWSDGKAQRWLPDVNGSRIVRTRPPYWNIIEAVPCIEVGSSVVHV